MNYRNRKNGEIWGCISFDPYNGCASLCHRDSDAILNLSNTQLRDFWEEVPDTISAKTGPLCKCGNPGNINWVHLMTLPCYDRGYPLGKPPGYPLGKPNPEPPVIDWSMSNDMGYLQRINREVADYLFPNRTTTSMFLKMFEEISEMVADPESSEEAADLMIMLLDHIDRCTREKMGHAVLLKLDKNLRRKWVEDPETGIYKGGAPK